MAEAVDSIIAVLEARIGNYAKTFNEAADAHQRFTITRPDKVGGFSSAEVEQYANRHKKAVGDIATAEEAGAEKVKRVRKAKAEASIATDKTEVESAKRAAKEKADVEIAEAERSRVRLANIQRTIDEQESRRARGNRSGTLRETDLANPRIIGPSIPASVLDGGAAAEVAAVKEVDHLTADIATKQAAIVGLKGAEKREQQDILAGMRLEKQLRAAGVAEEEILLRLETQRTAVAATRAAEERKSRLAGATKFAEGAGIGRTGGTGAAVAGIGTAIVAAAIVSAVDTAVSRGKEIAAVSEQLGISTKQLQIYEAAAAHVGVTNEQVRSSFGQLQNEIGKAKEGDQSAIKAFAALGVNIKNVGSAGDFLPTLIDRLSSIKDPAHRAAIETKFLGEEGRKLDGLLSGGNAQIEALGAALERAGAILSDPEIKNLDKTAAKLESVKNQLAADVSGVVAGNADAIQTLAGSFANLASDLLKYAAAQDRAAAASVLKIDPFQRDIPSVAINALGGKTRAQQIAQARATLIQSPEGRKILLDQNRVNLRATAVEVPLENGRDTAAVQALRAERLKPLLDERRAIYQAARDQAKTDKAPPVQPGVVNEKLLSQLGAPKPPKGKSAESIEKEAEARQKRFDDEIANLQEEQLRAQQQLTGDIDARAKIENELADRALKRKLADIESQRKTDVLSGEDKGVAAQRARQLSAEARKATLAEKAVIEQQRQIDLNVSITAHLEQSLSSQASLLDAQLSLATTAKERNRIELALLANAEAQERASLNRQLDGLKPDDPARRDVQASIDALPGIYGARRQVTERQNEGPLARLRRSYDDPATQVEQAVADKLKDVDDAITNAAARVLGVKDPFLKSLLQIFLQQNVLRPLYDALQSAQGGGGIGGILGSVLSLFGGGGGGGAGSIASASASSFGSTGLAGIGFASGGSMTIGGNPGTDQNQLSLNGRRIARVGQGEVISINPNAAASNRRVNAPAMSPIVIAPQHYDLSGVVMTESLVKGLREDNRRYADAVGKAAVQASGAQAPGIIQRKQTLGN